MDPQALCASWARVAQYGEQVPLYFYSHLFLSHPEVQVKDAERVAPPTTNPSIEPKMTGGETATPAASTSGAGATSNAPSILP